MSRILRASFVVRLVEERGGQVSGVIERVATGAKEAFRDLDGVGVVIRGMLEDERAPARAGLESTPPSGHPDHPERPRDGSVRSDVE
jgi:hypothetical protein